MIIALNDNEFKKIQQSNAIIYPNMVDFRQVIN